MNYDKNLACVIQAEESSEGKGLVRPKPDIARQMHFDCLQEKYSDDQGFDVFDSEDILTVEKGKDKYDQMMANRKEANEIRKNKDGVTRDPSKIFVKNHFNSEEERKRT